MKMNEHKFMMELKIPSPGKYIRFKEKIMLIGSCFTEHIGNYLHDMKFSVMQNPNGILFDPLSVAQSLVAYTRKDHYKNIDLFFHNDIWQSWEHHSRFSGTDKEQVYKQINDSHQQAHEFLKDANWLIITLGTSFSYKLRETGVDVANCHKAPANLFLKELLSVEKINASLDNCLHQLFHFNPKLQVIFTVSPVRHGRDGLIDNNRSKARLIEVVHHLVNKFDRLHYFPAYELVIDVLRDYRFYDIDLVHPNYQATQFVTSKFAQSFIDIESQHLMQRVQEIITSSKHRPFHPATPAHQSFLSSLKKKIEELNALHPELDFTEQLKLINDQQLNDE